ncbi:MAG: chromate resistance protein [Betaproteobacteria bacterium]|nr:chromate resistance protein [Betaproteobacteria bacterium]
MLDNSTWLALIISLPTRNATARMRVWRGLKALGCGVLRDGVYLLPQGAGAQEALAQEAAEVATAGGNANLVALSATDERQELSWRRLFDRSDDYARLTRELQTLQAGARAMPAAALTRKLAGLRRNFAEVGAIDFFPGAAREQAQRLLEETERAIQSVLSPDEPHAVARSIPQLRRADYRRRTWATRKRPWVDRLASAWLIKRFIDRDAKFSWIDKPRDCPALAVGFDFDGAEFTHVGNRVTFEVLLAAFGLDDDRALARLAMAVHYLDTGGIPVEDASGLNTILLGARSSAKTDDQLLSEALKIFDFIHSAYQEHAANDE